MSLVGPVFRRVSVADTELVAAFMRAYYALDGLTFDQARVYETLSKLEAAPSLGRIFVIRSDGIDVGYFAIAFSFSLEFHGRDAFLDEFFIAETARGQGIGRAALTFAETFSRENGALSLHLGVEKRNDAARKFYARLGYPDVGRSLLSKRLT